MVDWWRITVDGVELTRQPGWHVESFDSRRNLPAVRLSDTELPGVHGVLPSLMETFEDRDHVLTMWVFGASTPRFAGGSPLVLPGADARAQFDRNIDTLWSLFGNRHRLLDMRVAMGDGSVRQGFVRCVQAVQAETAIYHDSPAQRFAVALSLPSVFWADVDEATFTGTPGGVSPHSETVTPLTGGTAPIEDATVTVHGPADAGVRVSQPDTGAYVQLDRALAVGDSWVLDCGGWTSKVGAANVVADTVYGNSGARFLTLTPVAHTNDTVFRTNFSTDPGLSRSGGDVVVATNLAPDPSFEYGRVGWTDKPNATFTLDTAFPRSGAQALRIERSEDDNSPATFWSPSLEPDTTYTFTAWVRRDVGGTSGCMLRLGGAWVASANSNVATENGVYERLSVTATTDSSSSPRVLYLYGPLKAGEICWYDDLTLTVGSTAPDAFSGDTPTDDTYSYRWTGTPGASASEQVARRAVEWDASVLLTAGGAVMTAGTATLTTAAPDGTSVTVASDAGDLTATVTSGEATVTAPVGTVLSSVMVGDGAFFDGDTPPADGKQYRWTSAPGASTSEEYGPGTDVSREVRVTLSGTGFGASTNLVVTGRRKYL